MTCFAVMWPLCPLAYKSLHFNLFCGILERIWYEMHSPWAEMMSSELANANKVRPMLESLPQGEFYNRCTCVGCVMAGFQGIMDCRK